MSATTTTRYRETGGERFRRLLSAWLETLPPDGWTGGVAELFTSLDAFEGERKFYAFVPSSSGLTKALLAHGDAIRTAGFTLRVGRTKSARFIMFAPARG